MFQGKYILAPLTKGGNLPFRRLCVEFGADATVSEMAYARFVAKGDRRERALLRSHATESCFGVQLAVIQPDEAIAASKAAVDQGARFIDINCGCPIHDTTRRGLGASVLRRPNKLEALVSALSTKMNVPITVKIRLGWNEAEMNALEIAERVAAAGAAALTVHGRTREQRYSKAADWRILGDIKKRITIPVVGNGDILTHFESEDRMQMSGVDSVLIARGALVKPWIFTELKKGETLDLTAEERAVVYYRLARYMKEHFGDDELGRRRILQFLPWHFSFFHRYVYLPKSEFLDRSREHPLIQSRIHPAPTDDLLHNVLASPSESVHLKIALTLLDASETDVADKLREIPLDAPCNSPEERDNSDSLAAG